MKAVMLTIVAIITLTGCCHAQVDSLKVTMASVLDKTIDRVCEGLGAFADESGMAVEVAFPHAVKYVGAQRAVALWTKPFFVMFFLALLGLGLYGLHKDWNEMGMGWLIVLGVFGIAIFGTWGILCLQDWYIFQHAPEAATVEYLMKLM